MDEECIVCGFRGDLSYSVKIDRLSIVVVPGWMEPEWDGVCGQRCVLVFVERNLGEIK